MKPSLQSVRVIGPTAKARKAIKTNTADSQGRYNTIYLSSLLFSSLFPWSRDPRYSCNIQFRPKPKTCYVCTPILFRRFSLFSVLLSPYSSVVCLPYRDTVRYCIVQDTKNEVPSMNPQYRRQSHVPTLLLYQSVTRLVNPPEQIGFSVVVVSFGFVRGVHAPCVWVCVVYKTKHEELGFACEIRFVSSPGPGLGLGRICTSVYVYA